MKAANLALRFLLELTALGAFAYWGARRHLVLAILLPLAMVVYWGFLVAPKSRLVARRALRLMLGLPVFFLAAAAIADTGHTLLGWSFGLIALVNTALAYAAGPQPGETSTR